jgi:hypothetical protein
MLEDGPARTEASLEASFAVRLLSEVEAEEAMFAE